MKKSYFDSGGNDTELIAVLNAISHVSARMARNMTILAQQRQSEKGERRYVANIELVPNITYVSSTVWTYIVDDDIVINGWYFLNGEPKIYVRDTPDASYASWGRNQMARYKTYALREWIFRSNVYNLYRELFLITPYLATINNLGTPVIKTADKTMKITYTITEE